MESFQIVFLSWEKRGWAMSRVFSSKTDEMFPPVSFWVGDSPEAEADAIMVKTWHWEKT